MANLKICDGRSQLYRYDTGVKIELHDFASGTGYIYVPAASVDVYKNVGGWKAYAAQFRALEDYTVDGTITGELDESKI